MAELGWDGSGRQGGPNVEVGSTRHTARRLTFSVTEARSGVAGVRGIVYACGRISGHEHCCGNAGKQSWNGDGWGQARRAGCARRVTFSAIKPEWRSWSEGEFTRTTPSETLRWMLEQGGVGSGRWGWPGVEAGRLRPTSRRPLLRLKSKVATGREQVGSSRRRF